MKLAVIWARYRSAFKTGAVIGLAVSNLMLLFVTISTLDQSRRNGDQIRDQLIHIRREDKIIRDHIDCVVDLFAHEDHTNISISDIKGCKIKISPPTPQKATVPDTPITTPESPKPQTTKPKDTTSSKEDKPAPANQHNLLEDTWISVRDGLKSVRKGLGL